MRHPIRSRIKIALFCMSIAAIVLRPRPSHNPAAPAAVLATTKNHYPFRAMRLGLSNPQSRHGTASRTPRSRAALLEPAAALAEEAISTALGLPSASAAGGTANGAIVITSGRISGEGLSGHVSPNGSAAAAGAAGGVS